MNPFRELFDYDRPETRGEVLLFKLFECFLVVVAVYLAWSWGFYIRRLNAVVLPLGIAQYVDIARLYGTPIPLINAGLITLLAGLGFFRATRFAYLGCFLLLHVQFATRFTLGAIPHSSNMLGMTLLGLALAMLVFDDALHQRRFTLGFTYFFVGLGYTLAGFSKLIGTGLMWADGRHLWMWVHEKGIDVLSKTGALDYNALQELVLQYYPVATAFLAFGLLTELLAFLMWWRRLRTPVILAVLGLHVGIYLVMSIMFYLSVIELLFLGFPWAVWIDWGLQHAPLRTVLAPLEKLSVRFA